MTGASALQDILTFTGVVLEELRKGETCVRNGDKTRLQHCVTKLEEYAGMLLRLVNVLSEERVKEQLKRLIPLLSDFTVTYKADCTFIETESQCTSICTSSNVSAVGGRPEIQIPLPAVNALRATGMSFTAIASHLKISRRTLYKVRNLIVDDEEVNDAELMEIVTHLKEENPRCGEKFVRGHLTATRRKATQEKVRQTLRLVDPIGTVFRHKPKTKRRPYSVPGPNHLWHMDGNEKLQPFRIYIHGCVDGYSRKILYVQCEIDKKASTVLSIFKKCINNYGIPKVVRSDKGLENKKVAKFMFRNRGSSSNCFITGKSVHNIRVERMWVEINKVTIRYKYLLNGLQTDGIIDLDNEVHMLSIFFIFLPRIQRSLDLFKNQWNCHKLRTAGSKSPDELYLTGNAAEVSVLSDVESSSDSDDGHSDEDTSGDNVKEEYIRFATFAKTVIPCPLLDDGADGVNHLRMLLNHL